MAKIVLYFNWLFVHLFCAKNGPKIDRIFHPEADAPQPAEYAKSVRCRLVLGVW